MVFSHVAETTVGEPGYFTGLALLNGGTSSADFTVTVYRVDGSVLGSFTGSLPANGRTAKLLRELPGIGDAVLGRTNGYFTVTSTQPIYGIAVFGTSDLSALASIPPQ